MASVARSSWPAPAKLNLFLHITGRRADGYHELQTCFQLLDYGDRLDFELLDDGGITRAGDLPGVDPDADLCVWAARALQEAAGTSLGVRIHLDKRLPMGGGLGGGSSDAATVLVALNRLWGCDLPASRLLRIGAALGADVPVFVRGHSAWAEGVGERLQSLDLPDSWYLVVRPAVEISTAALFEAPELTRNCPRIRIGDFLSGAGTNVFEPLVRERYEEVAQALDWLDAQVGPGNPGARLTGTGSCVFVRFGQETEARALHGRLPAGWEGFVARGVNRSPLLWRLDDQ